MPDGAKTVLTEFQEAYHSARHAVPSDDMLASLISQPVTDLIASDKTIQCKAGCAYCCHLRVTAYVYEIVGIYQRLQKLPAEQLDAACQRIEAQYAEIKELTVQKRRERNITCPMLVEDHCIVHEVRPVSCAGHHSTDVYRCQDGFLYPDVTEITYEHPGVPMLQSVKTEQSAQEQLARQVIKEAGDNPEKVELISSLYQLFADPDLVRQWQQGEQILCEGN